MEVIFIKSKIGNTPIKRLLNYEKKYNINTPIYAKLEYQNIFGSIKDRSALQMIEDAIKSGELNQDKSIIEASSGNLGISIAAISNLLGYKCEIIMPENMSNRRKELIKSYSANIILTDATKGMTLSINTAITLAHQNSNYYYLNQFANKSNVRAHLKTANEIDLQLNGNIDYIIAGIGSGGTVTGLGEYFKNSHTKIIGVEPSNSPILTKGYAGTHKIQGIGAGFKPPILNLSLIDKIIAISDEEAFYECKMLSEIENIDIGISSGAVLSACKKLIQEYRINNQSIVLIFADGGDRYK